ncbi:MAG: AAA family ATPase [Thermodesulfobacteriota bacterium]
MAFPTNNIKKLVASGYPIMYLVSFDENYVQDSIKKIGSQLLGDKFSFVEWSSENAGNSSDISKSFDDAVNSFDTGFLFVKDLNFYINDPKIIRKLKDFYNSNSGKPGKHLFLISSSLNLPPDLEKEITVVDIPLPDLDETREIFKSILSNPKHAEISEGITTELEDKCLHGLLGLGAAEMELALKRSIVGKKSLDDSVVDELLEEKAQLVRKSGTLDFIRSRIKIDQIGGLENIKDWLDTRANAYSSKAKEFGLDTPKGVLVMGISGCGKSLCAKAIATSWNLPLLRLDLNQVYSGLMGSPEDVFRRSIKTVEASAPCVLWIDEIEAGITRGGEKTSDSPASRIFGYFLTWMQEKDAPVFIAATANQIDLLPPEILRKGRFDEIFFVTLPSQKERNSIFQIHLRDRGKDPTLFDLSSLAKNSDGLSGAEIEQAVISAMYDSFSKEKEIDNNALVIATSSIVPLSTTMREEISKLERWASDRAVKASKG